MGSEVKVKEIHPVTHVIFDMDGLLLDTERLYSVAISTVCERYGSIYTPEVKRLAMGRVATACAEVIIGNCNLPLTIPDYLAEVTIEHKKVFQNVDFMPGAFELVNHLHSHGIPIAVATSSKRETFDLKAKGKDDFFGLFHHIVLASDDPEVKRGKPAPDSFLVAAQRFKNPPVEMKNVLVFEDSRLGVQAGLAAGMQVVWVPDLTLLDPSTENPTLIIPSLQNFKPEMFKLPHFK